MLRRVALAGGAAGILGVGFALGGCGKIQPDNPAETILTRAVAKRHKDACASNSAYDHMKREIFNQAGRKRISHQKNLITLEEFAFVRMENPVVVGFDPTLDITRCRGRFILDVPPGSAQAFGSEHQLQADINYTAQGAADASGLVYVIHGAEPIVSKLAAFNLADASSRPLPALDAGAQAEMVTDEPPSTTTADMVRDPRQKPDRAVVDSANVEPVPRQAPVPPIDERRSAARELTAITPSAAKQPDGLKGGATVRAFYNALGAGDGNLASAQVIPAKRSSRAYSPDAISRFYGRLAEPLRLTGVSALPDGTFRVTYHYAGAGTRCNGSAVVRLTPAPTHPLIRSITAGRGC